MNRKTLIIIGLQAFIIVVLFWLLVFYGKDEYEASTRDQEEEIESASHVVTGKGAEDGAATISLSSASQQQSGITVTKLEAASHQATTSYFGVVVGLDDLVELRTRYLTARADANVARASLINSQQEYQRLLSLNHDNKNISDRAVAIAETALKSDQVRIAAAEATANAVRDSMRQRWGDKLADWATRQKINNSFSRLLQHQDVLLQITLPFDAAAPDENTSLLVQPSGAKGKTINASLISPSPQTDNTVQGKTYYYRAPASNLRTSMRVTASLAAQDDTANGVIVPDTAVVWYANKAWVYQKQGADKFIRRQINTDIEANNESDNGWFNASGVKADDEVVTSGAQLLLSEEFKYQITNENDD